MGRAPRAGGRVRDRALGRTGRRRIHCTAEVRLTSQATTGFKARQCPGQPWTATMPGVISTARGKAVMTEERVQERCRGVLLGLAGEDRNGGPVPRSLTTTSPVA